MPTIEHKIPVVKHWICRGRNVIQDTRLDFFNDKANMEILPKFINSEEGGKLKERYMLEVGIGFRGPGE